MPARSAPQHIDVLAVVGACLAGWSNDLLAIPIDVSGLGGGVGGVSSSPVSADLLRTLANVIRRIQQEENTGRVRSGSQRVHGGAPTFPETVGPMLDLSMMTTFPAGLMVIDDQAASL